MFIAGSHGCSSSGLILIDRQSRMGLWMVFLPFLSPTSCNFESFCNSFPNSMRGSQRFWGCRMDRLFFPGLKFHTVDVHGGVIRPTTSAGDVGLFAGASSANLETGALGPFRSPKGDETNEPKHILIE